MYFDGGVDLPSSALSGTRVEKEMCRSVIQWRIIARTPSEIRKHEAMRYFYWLDKLTVHQFMTSGSALGTKVSIMI